MSIKSWRKEFIPIPASKISKEDAVEHCLQRWIGFLPENLEKHNIIELPFNGGGQGGKNDCSLCQFWGDDDYCPGCPCILLTGMDCEGEDTEGGGMFAFGDSTPIQILRDNDDPTPGIMLLEIMLLEGY